MKCQFCNFELRDKAKFCPLCGRDVPPFYSDYRKKDNFSSRQSDIFSKTGKKGNNAGSKRFSEERKSNTALKVIACSAALILIIAGTAGIVLSNYVSEDVTYNGLLSYLNGTDRKYRELYNKTYETEINLLSLNMQLNNVIYAKTDDELTSQIKILNSSRNEFENSLNRLTDLSTDDEEVIRGMSKVADLSRSYLDIIDTIADLKRQNMELTIKANKSQADFIAWRPVFRQMIQELKLKATDDYVDNVMLNLLTYQSLVEKKVLEALGSDNYDEIVKDRKSVGVFIVEYEEWADNLYSEMPEARDEIGALIANFKYSCSDDNGVVGQHENLVKNTNDLANSMYNASKQINYIKAEINRIQENLEYLSNNFS